MAIDPRRGAAFDDTDVARAYAHRAPYPETLIARLKTLTPGHAQLLDLGCGPGKIALSLAGAFGHVDAVDPSAPMLAVARAAAQGRTNIRWILAPAETAPLEGPYDLVTAGASLHWMRYGDLFPRLAAVMARGGRIAVLDGDGAADAPWKAEETALCIRWVERRGDRWDPEGRRASAAAWEDFARIEGREVHTGIHCQSLEDFIDAAHSRATFTRAEMGAANVEAFDAEFRAVLAPHARDGMLTYGTRTTLVFGAVRQTAP